MLYYVHPVFSMLLEFAGFKIYTQMHIMINILQLNFHMYSQCLCAMNQCFSNTHLMSLTLQRRARRIQQQPRNMPHSMAMAGKGFLSGMKFGLLGVVLDPIHGRSGSLKWWGELSLRYIAYILLSSTLI